MTTNQKVDGATPVSSDDLGIISDIGPKTVKALHQIGVHHFADLAQFTPAELAKALYDQTGLKVSDQRIAAKDWIGQAKRLACQPNHAVIAAPNRKSERTPAAARSPRTMLDGTACEQYAGFSLFFDYGLDEQGKQEGQTRIWQTTVYHEEADKQMQFSGLAAEQWINWILDQAALPDTLASAFVTQKPSEPSALIMPNDGNLTVLDVQVQAQPQSDPRNPQLATEIHFAVSDPDGALFTPESLPYQILLLVTEENSHVTKLIAAEHGQFQPKTATHIHQLVFPVPTVGCYTLQTIVLVSAESELIATQRGPEFQVVSRAKMEATA